MLDELVPDGPVVLVGHSMGGMTVMALAEQEPELFGERVVGVGLISTAAGGLRTHKVLHPLLPDRIMRQITPRAMALLARAPARGRRPPYRLRRRLPGHRQVRVRHRGARVLRRVRRRDARADPFEVLAEFFPNFDLHDKFSVLHAFEVATVIVCGTDGVITSIGHSRKMAERIRGAQLVEVLDAGHMALMERADQVSSALERMVAAADAHQPGSQSA